MPLYAPLVIGASFANQPGVRAKSRNTARDAQIALMPNLHRYLDPEAPLTDVTLKSGYSIANAATTRHSWTSNGISIVTDANFNNRRVFNLTGTNSDWKFQAGGIRSAFTFITCFSIPAATLTSLGNSNISRYLFSHYDPVANNFGAVFFLFSVSNGATRGFSFNPFSSGAGAASNSGSSVIPVADKAVLVGLRYDGVNTSRMFFNDFATPSATRTNHTANPPTEATREVWPASVFANTAVGWTGKLGPMIWLDDTNAATRTTDAQFQAIGANLRTYYGITP